MNEEVEIVSLEEELSKLQDKLIKGANEAYTTVSFKDSLEAISEAVSGEASDVAAKSIRMPHFRERIKTGFRGVCFKAGNRFSSFFEDNGGLFGGMSDELGAAKNGVG